MLCFHDSLSWFGSGSSEERSSLATATPTHAFHSGRVHKGSANQPLAELERCVLVMALGGATKMHPVMALGGATKMHPVMVLGGATKMRTSDGTGWSYKDASCDGTGWSYKDACL